MIYYVFQAPKSEKEWLDVAAVYDCRWNFPNCISALDGKHIRIKKPDHGGSLYYNYKGYHSITLMAAVSGNYEFLYVDVGGEGRQSDGGIWRHCSLRKKLAKGKLHLLGARPLPGSEYCTKQVFVGDDAFPLGPNLMKPFSRRQLSHDERVFNYRLSRARRCSENAFGILASRFRLFLTEIDAHPDKVSNCVLAAICLHNMLRRRCGRNYITPGSVDYEDVDNNIIPAEWREYVHLDPLDQDQQRNASNFAKRQRLIFRNHFASPLGSVPWQNNIVRQ